MSRLAHHRPAHGTRPRPEAGSLGSTIVELAMVILLLFLLLAATFDYGFAWKSGLAANEAVRTGARVGSSAGDQRGADFVSLSGLKASLSASGILDGVERVVVFRATSADGAVPAGCKTGTGSNCQIITGAQFRTGWQTGTVESATTAKGCLNIATVKAWCPTDRVAEQNTAEYYGVWIKVRHDYLFPIIGDQVYIERTAVMRIEPEVA